jgi:Dehydroquinase class II
VKLLLLNGPNLGILGRREPQTYGTQTLRDIRLAVEDVVAERGWEVLSVQGASSGDCVASVPERRRAGCVLVGPAGARALAGIPACRGEPATDDDKLGIAYLGDADDRGGEGGRHRPGGGRPCRSLGCPRVSPAHTLYGRGVSEMIE